MSEATDDRKLRKKLEKTDSIAVIGMKGPGGGPAFSVPMYMAECGCRIVAVNPGLSPDTGLDAVPTVREISGPVDMVNIFRRPENIPAHVDEILAMATLPKVVWLQLGIRHDESAERLIAAGIDVVQDRCLLLEHRRLMR